MTTMPRALAFAALIAALGAAQVASAQEQTPPSAKPGRWTGSFSSAMVRVQSQVQSFSGGPSKYSGIAKITPVPGKQPLTQKVEIRVSSPSGVSLLQWGVARGRCGSVLDLLVPPGKLPALDVRAGGTATLDFEGVLVDFKLDGKYHVLIFLDGSGPQNVVSCADLRYEELKP